MIFMVVAAVATCMIIEEVVLGNKEGEVALILEGAGCVDLVVGWGDRVVVDLAGPKFFAFAAGGVVEDDLARFGGRQGG